MVEPKMTTTTLAKRTATMLTIWGVGRSTQAQRLLNHGWRRQIALQLLGLQPRRPLHRSRHRQQSLQVLLARPRLLCHHVLRLIPKMPRVVDSYTHSIYA